MTNYCMIKLALIGDSFCRRTQRRDTVTFTELLMLHYGGGIELVVQGRANGSTLGDKLEDLDQALKLDADVICVFHQPQNERATRVYQAEQELIYQKLMHTKSLVCHFQDRRSDNLMPKQHRRDLDVMNYPHDWFTEYRYCVPYAVSDNGVDSTGNRHIARKIMELIDERNTSLAKN